MRFYFRYILIFLIINNKWILVESTGSSATPLPSSGGDSGTPGQGATATPTGSPAGGSEPETKTGVELSLKATAATNEFDYEKIDKVVTFTAKDSFGFSSVKTGDKLIWEAKDKKYADSVTLYGKGKKSKSVTINIPNGINMAYVRNGKGKPWQEYDLSKTNPVSINVNTQSDSCVYTYKFEHKIATFTPKEGFVFNEVNYSRSVWKATKEDEYANKVEREGDRKVSIYINNGSVKVFLRGEGYSWKEYTQASTQKSSTDGSGGGGTPASPKSGGGTTGTDGSGGTDQSGGGTTGTDGSCGGGTTPASPTSGGGTTGTDGSGGSTETGGGGTQQSTPATQ